MRYPVDTHDSWPAKADFAHIPHADTSGFSDEEIRQMVDNSCTVRAKRLQPECVTLWGREYRSYKTPQGFQEW